MTTTRHEWATVPKVLTEELLTQVATIAGGYSVIRGDGGWAQPESIGEAILFEEPNATLRVDGLNIGHAAIIDGLILRSARHVGEQAIWRTVTVLADARLLETAELQIEDDSARYCEDAECGLHGREC